MEQNRRPRYESMWLCQPDFQERHQKHAMEKIKPLQQCCWENWVSAWGKLDIYRQKTESRSMFVTLYKYQLIKDLNIRPETLKLVQERAGNALELIGINNYFLKRSQMAQQLRERIDKWDYMKLKSFCTAKEMVSKLKRLSSEWRKSLPAVNLTGLITRITGSSKN
jgi:hypothetical protein